MLRSLESSSYRFTRSGLASRSALGLLEEILERVGGTGGGEGVERAESTSAMAFRLALGSERSHLGLVLR